MRRGRNGGKWMAKVILLCGRLCCGKSTYAAKLCREGRAVTLSVDEVMLALFGPYAGERHDLYAARTEGFLLEKSLELVRAGVDVVLDWGPWQKEKRTAIRDFYVSRGIPFELHALEVDDATWRARIETRNRDVAHGACDAYPVDENLLAKFASRYEPPDPSEVDVWVTDAEKQA